MFHTTNAKFRSTLSLVALAALLGTGALAEDMPELIVTLGTDDHIFNPTTSSVFQLAQEFGYYEKHGVKITFVGLDGTPAAAAALRSGAVDVANIGIDAAIRLEAGNNLPVRGFLSVGAGIPFLIASKDDITSLEDLKGRSFAISDVGGLDHVLTQQALRGSGIDPETPSFVAIGAPSVRVQALAVERVDATTVSFGTYAAIDGTPGIHVLMSPDAFVPLAPAQSKLLVARAETIETKRDAIQSFTDAILEASRDYDAHPEKWVAAAAAARPDLSQENVEKTAEFNSKMWCVNGCMQPDRLQASVDFIYSTPDFKDVKVVGLDDLVDYSFTDTALKEMGVAETHGFDSRK